MKRPKFHHVLAHQHPLGHQHLSELVNFAQKPLWFELPAELFPHLPRPVLFALHLSAPHTRPVLGIPSFNPHGPHTKARRGWKMQCVNVQSPAVQCHPWGRLLQPSCAVPQGQRRELICSDPPQHQSSPSASDTPCTEWGWEGKAGCVVQNEISWGTQGDYIYYHKLWSDLGINEGCHEI